jgi:type IV pilus assembly protein PilC
MGTNLPLATRILIGASDFVKNNQLPILLTIISAVLLLIIFSKQSKGKQVIDRLTLKLPLVGNLVIWYTTARFSRMMSNLLKAGLLLPDAINTMTRSVSNSVYRDSLVDLRKQLLQGQTLSSIVSKNSLFPQLLTEMINVGQVSGELDAAFGIVADYYEVKVERSIGKMTALIEPALILCLGLVVGFIAVSVISTIYGLVGGMS